jgi:4-alpha-glucanotransferase
MSLNNRNNGILLHITSLPSKYGIGDLGLNAYSFIDFLKRSDVGFWQILPLGPTGYGNSPYAARSTFAGNENLLSIDSLIEDGYLDKNVVNNFKNIKEGYIDFNIVENIKKPLLFKAADNFLVIKKEEKEYNKFLKENKFYLEDYALFMALVDHYYDARWYSVWDKNIARRDIKALKNARLKLNTEINRYKVLQYLFFKQWFLLKDYANKNNIKIIGDLPIFVAGDSVDAWANIELFKTDKNGHYNKVSGCPPDGFTKDGQLWGNPVYNWSVHEKTNYKWWILRIKQQFKLYDFVRIDHFRGFESYWEIDSNQKTAKYGKWVKGPGQKFFNTIKKELGDLPIIAEDLGYLTKEVENLRNNNNFPGMKVGIFGYNWDKNGNFDFLNMDLPTNYEENFIAYPGTHDNQTILGWFKSLKDYQKKYLLKILSTTEDNIVWPFIKELYASRARVVIIQMQDLLEKDDSARMNIPSTCGPFNWSWQMQENDNLDTLESILKLYNNYYNRVSK